MEKEKQAGKIFRRKRRDAAAKEAGGKKNHLTNKKAGSLGPSGKWEVGKGRREKNLGLFRDREGGKRALLRRVRRLVSQWWKERGEGTKAGPGLHDVEKERKITTASTEERELRTAAFLSEKIERKKKT